MFAAFVPVYDSMNFFYQNVVQRPVEKWDAAPHCLSSGQPRLFSQCRCLGDPRKAFP